MLTGRWRVEHCKVITKVDYDTNHLNELSIAAHAGAHKHSQFAALTLCKAVLSSPAVILPKLQ